MDQVHGKAEVIIGKQRHGPTGTVQLAFQADITRFTNLADEDKLLNGWAIDQAFLPNRTFRPHFRGRGRRPPPCGSRRARRELEALRERAGGAETAAVVKAEAYGTGIEQAVPALLRAGRRTFFVAHLSEAPWARAVAPDATIYVLNGLLTGTGPTTRNTTCARSSATMRSEEWAAFCRAGGKRFKVAIHVDTGMNRLGLTVEEGLALGSREILRISSGRLFMSHFVGAEETDNPLNARARSRPSRPSGRRCRAFRPAREFLRHLPRPEAAFRPRAAGLCPFMGATRRPITRTRCAPSSGSRAVSSSCWVEADRRDRRL